MKDHETTENNERKRTVEMYTLEKPGHMDHPLYMNLRQSKISSAMKRRDNIISSCTRGGVAGQIFGHFNFKIMEILTDLKRLKHGHAANARGIKVFLLEIGFYAAARQAEHCYYF